MNGPEPGRAGAATSGYEQAVEAIVSGNLQALQAILEGMPSLVHARSSREHGATLLHYVAANGVEDERQVTPPNIMAIARCLLGAGAEVDAEANLYGGGATTLGLVVTSAHPRRAGVQLELADLLLEHGAQMHPDVVSWCLMNGCPEAARHMAARGAGFGFREAAGLGRLDVLQEGIANGAMPAQGVAAFIMASWYGQLDAITLLLDHGVDPGSRPADDFGTALHIAAWQGNAKLASLLLARGAPLDFPDARYGTTPLAWALHAWLVEGREPESAYHDVLRVLALAGARVQAEWIDDDRVRAHADLHALLTCRVDGTA